MIDEIPSIYMRVTKYLKFRDAELILLGAQDK